MEGQSDEAGGGAEALTRPAVAQVVGPPRDVAALLRARGFDARVVDRTVLVRGASANEVTRALAGRPRGEVDVVTE